MRKILVVLAVLAVAASAFAGENSGKIVKDKFKVEGNPFEVILNDTVGNKLVHLTVSEMDDTKGDVKVWWLDPENMPKPDAKLNFTWGDRIEECTVESNVVGLMQLQNFSPEGGATIQMHVYFVGDVANRLKLGIIKHENIRPVFNRPGEWGSVVNTSGLKGDKEGGIKDPKYLDLSEYGATVEVKGNSEAILTWVYQPMKGPVIDFGQCDLGLMVVEK